MNTEPIDLRAQAIKGYTGRGALDWLDLEGIAGHHSVSGWVWNPITQEFTGQAWNEAVDISQEVEVAHILAIDRLHNQEAFGYCGFGYHIAVFASGRWYLVGDLNTLRAHVASRNWGWIGIVFIGDYTDAVPTPQAIEGGQRAASWVRKTVERELAVRPHRLVPGQNTTCPGARYAEWVSLIDAGWKEEPMPTPAQWQVHREETRRSFNRIRAAMFKIDAAWPLSDQDKANATRNAAENAGWAELLAALNQLKHEQFDWRGLEWPS